MARFTASSDGIKAAINLVAPVWLHNLSVEIIDSAKNFASKFGSATRNFWYSVTSNASAGDAGAESKIYCEGPHVESTAFDTEFDVPVGGFQYGDKDPITNEAFPGGQSKHGTYVSLVDKPQSEGQSVKSVARTYSKFSGQHVKIQGFFDRAIRQHIGEGEKASPVGVKHLQTLGVVLGKEIALNIVDQIKNQYEPLGYTVTTTGPSIIETESH